MSANQHRARTRAESLTLGLGVLRLVKEKVPDLPRATALAAGQPNLSESLEKDIASKISSFSHVQDFVKEAISATPAVDPLRLQKPNFLRSARNNLPDNSKITHLNLDTGKSIRDPEAMAQTLKADLEQAAFAKDYQ